MARKTYLIKTKYGDFSAKIWHDRLDQLYLVETVQFDRTMTQGSTLTEAKKQAKSLIEFLVECAVADGNIVIDEKRRVAGKDIRPGIAMLA